MKGYPITIWFDSLESANTAAQAIGDTIAERELASYTDREAFYYIIRDAFGKPSKALQVGNKATRIPARKRGAHDR
jgi:hypothetical protein